MSLMLSPIIFSFLLVMAVGGSGEGAIVSNSATDANAYWQTMLPNTPMPSAILELLPDNSAEVGNEGESHGDVTVAFFLEEALTPGSTITPNIPSSSTSGALLLRRDAAASIPMSTRNFTDFMKMLAPVSHSMANDIWSTLTTCAREFTPCRGRKEDIQCVTSLESMVEYVASILTRGNTRNLRSFSSPDVPTEGVVSGRKYKVSAARRTTELSESATCHGMRFPYPVFMCHALNPTRVYTVTLEKEEDVGGAMGGGGPDRMAVLAVCHLDTSGFEPKKMPAHVKPGDAPICHFIARDGIIWAPATPSIPA